MKKLVVLILCLGFISCIQTNEVAENIPERIRLGAQNLPALKSGEGHYQLWATFFQFNKRAGNNSPQHEGDYVSLGEFRISEGGAIQGINGGSPNFALPSGLNPQLLQDIVIALQADTGHEGHAEPGSIIIGGRFYGDATIAQADMDVAYADAFNANFSATTAKATIVAPTSAADSNSGVWFVERGATVTAGIRNLPRLPSEWKYEGWVVERLNGVVNYYSTGKFSRADSADLDGGGPNRGTGTPFNFPGQDFIVGSFRPNLTGSQFTFMITMEPSPDNSRAPFSLVLMQTSAAPTPGRTQTLQNVLIQSAPTARVVIVR